MNLICASLNNDIFSWLIMICPSRRSFDSPFLRYVTVTSIEMLFQ